MIYAYVAVVKNSNIVVENISNKVDINMKYGIIKSPNRRIFFMAFNDYFQSSTPDLSFEEKVALFKSNSFKAIELRSQINNSQSNKLARVQALPNEDKTIKEDTTKPIETSPFIKEIYDRISILNINSLEEYEILEKIKAIFSGNLNSITINKIKLLL